MRASALLFSECLLRGCEWSVGGCSHKAKIENGDEGV